MRKLILAAVALALVSGSAMAQTDKQLKARENSKACSAEWKVKKEANPPAKGEGRKAWTDFRSQCLKGKAVKSV